MSSSTGRLVDIRNMRVMHDKKYKNKNKNKDWHRYRADTAATDIGERQEKSSNEMRKKIVSPMAHLLA
jgi:hypothetical protein